MGQFESGGRKRPTSQPKALGQEESALICGRIGLVLYSGLQLKLHHPKTPSKHTQNNV